MENVDPHKKHHYSMDQIILQAFSYETRSVLPFDKKNDNIRVIVERYMNDRVKEITNRWK